MAQINITLSQEEILQLMQTDRSDAFKKIFQESLNAFIKAESDEQLQAKPYERTEERTDSRNGTRERDLVTRLGTITLKVPRHRDQPFHTSVFDNYQRSESALIVTMAEMVIAGVSTRKVSKTMETLCGKSFSKASVSEACKVLDSEIKTFKNRKLELEYPFVIVDATYFKVRENRKVVSKAFMIAQGINEMGQRELIGFDSYEDESNETWDLFFKSLIKRGLRGVRMVTSDSHKGILNAIMKNLPNVPWQRCQYHFTKNIVEKAPKAYQEGLRSELRTLFRSPDIDSATKKMNQIAADYRDVCVKAVECLELGFLDSMTNLLFPKNTRFAIRTSNYLERFNRELKRRSVVIGIFPSEDSLIRLMGSVAIDYHEQIIAKRRIFYRPTLIEIEEKREELNSLAKEQHKLLLAA